MEEADGFAEVFPEHKYKARDVLLLKDRAGSSMGCKECRCRVPCCMRPACHSVPVEDIDTTLRGFI